MKRTALANGAVYQIPAEDIEYIGYFYGVGGKENLPAAYKRIGTERGKAPDFLINAELFDMNTRKAASDVVEQGKIHRLTAGHGMAFPGNTKAEISYCNYVKAPDYVGFYPTLIRNGKRAFTYAPAGIGGTRGRTTIAVNGAGDVFLALIPDKSGATLENVADYLIAAGATDGGNLDGGGSSQWYTPGGCIYTGRAVRGYIGIWLKEGKSKIDSPAENKISITPLYISKGKPNRPGRAMQPKYITIHETGNYAKGADAYSHAKYLRSTSEKVSWHYTVDDLGAYQHLPDNESAYHAGDGATGTGNAKSIGIEICVNADGNFGKACSNAAALVRKLMAEHNIPIENVVQHNRWNGKNCPRNLRKSGWSEFIRNCGGAQLTSYKTVKVKSVLNIRRNAPNSLGINTSKVIGTYANGAKVAVYESKAGWWRTERGWCCGLYLK